MRQGKEGVLLTVRKLFRRLYWMSASVFILGLLSTLMLICVDRINQSARTDLDHCDAVMDVRIRTGSAHLLVQDAFSGDTTVDTGQIFAEIDQAMGLVEALLNGGASEHGLPLRPLKDPAQRKSTEGIRSLLTQFRSAALQMMQGQGMSTSRPLYERFHALFKEIEHEADAVEDALEEHAARTEAAGKRLLWGIFVTWILIIVSATVGLWHREKGRRAARQALQQANEQLQAQTGELEKHREHLMDMVEARTAELTTTNLHLHDEIAERKKIEQSLRDSESQLRRLSYRLLTAQEAERRRISRELHDELGGSLAALKMGLSQVEKGLREDQAELRERCRGNADAVDLVIDNVSRLSRALSPFLLEEFGLSAALERLVSNFGKTYSDIRASLAVTQIDHLLPPGDQIGIYRIIQESLTNAAKHSGAKNVSVSVERRNGNIVIVVEDDGKGFAAGPACTNDFVEKGMGLATMDERAKMLGGTCRLWSREGKGTRLTFTIPAREGDI